MMRLRLLMLILSMVAPLHSVIIKNEPGQTITLQHFTLAAKPADADGEMQCGPELLSATLGPNTEHRICEMKQDGVTSFTLLAGDGYMRGTAAISLTRVWLYSCITRTKPATKTLCYFK